MNFAFENRTAAGKALADLLRHHTDEADLLVLALPRGGVPVAFEVAQALGAELDVMVVRKLGVPGQEELAFGAIASGGIQVLNDDVVAELELTQEDMAPVVERQRHELLRRERLYRAGRSAPDVKGRTVILVDDGIATGATMRAAIRALRERKVGRVVVAVPTVALQIARRLEPEVDEWVAALTPTQFWGVARWYYDFSQTTDQEVIALLAHAAQGDRGRSQTPYGPVRNPTRPLKGIAASRVL
ncbi:MAG: phosphoribosyltransferase [Rhodoferax sp.]|nr:phosphoribosyltransferase [Rhodoferax sp.]